MQDTFYLLIPVEKIVLWQISIMKRQLVALRSEVAGKMVRTYKMASPLSYFVRNIFAVLAILSSAIS